MRFFASCLAVLLVILSLGSCEAAPDYLFLISEEAEESDSISKKTTSLVEDNATSLGLPTESEELVPATTQGAETSDFLTTNAPVTTTANTDSTVSPPDSSFLRLVSLTEQVPRGQTASITVCGTPYATYRIEVYYATTVSTAKGLEPKTANADGTVTWQWKVGTRTKSGSHRIVIRGSDGESLTLFFTTTK